MVLPPPQGLCRLGARLKTWVLHPHALRDRSACTVSASTTATLFVLPSALTWTWVVTPNLSAQAHNWTRGRTTRSISTPVCILCNTRFSRFALLVDHMCSLHGLALFSRLAAFVQLSAEGDAKFLLGSQDNGLRCLQTQHASVQRPDRERSEGWSDCVRLSGDVCLTFE